MPNMVNEATSRTRLNKTALSSSSQLLNDQFIKCCPNTQTRIISTIPIFANISITIQQVSDLNTECVYARNLQESQILLSVVSL